MPWHIAENHGDCPTERPWAVVKDDTGEVAGCHSSQAEAEDHLRALYANDEEPAERGFAAVLIIEGERTMDGREWAPGSLTWREPPLPLMMLKTNPEDGHKGSVIAGRIERIWREGSEIRGEGRFASTVEGMEAADLMDQQMLRWVSADTEIDDYEVLQEGCEGDELEDLLETECVETLRVRSGRIAGATMVAFPAFPAAVIVPQPVLIPAGSQNGRPAVADANTYTTTVIPSLTIVNDIHTFVTDAPWNGAASRFTDEQWKRATAACEGKSEAPKSDCYLPHHEPGGAVSRAGVHAAAARYNQTQRANRDRARGHIAGHYRNDLKEEVPDVLKASALVAHAARFPVEPPAEWFADPGLTDPTPLTVTDEGRIYGSLVGSWDQCHIGISDRCVPPPRGSNYSYFLVGSVKCPTGCDISTGTITLVGGHADTLLDWRAAAAHYDETRSAIADVTVGENEQGIWFAGALRPHVTDEQVRILRASGVSGDWRPIGGRLELIGICAVNHPGFPVQRPMAASARVVGVHDGQVTALIAGGVPQEAPLLRRIRELEARLAAVEAIALPLRATAGEALLQSIR